MLVPEPVVAMVELTLNSIGHVSRSATTTAAKTIEVELMQPKTAKAVNASKTMLVPEPVVAMVELTLNSIGHVSRSATTTAAKPMEVELMQPKTAKAVNAAKTIEVELMQPKTAKAVNAAKPMKVELMQPKTAKAVN